MVERPDYNPLQDALETADADMGAAEAHGALCGMSCASGKAELQDWLAQIFDELNMENTAIQNASQLLVGLLNSTREQLNDPEAALQLLLPDEDTKLAARVEALAHWCQGFTYGLGAGGLKETTELPADTQELIRDMVEIARAAHDEESVDEADEEDYMHLQEYVRMGVLLINEELQPIKAPPQTDQ